MYPPLTSGWRPINQLWRTEAVKERHSGRERKGKSDMTNNQLAKELIKEFGPGGATRFAYEQFLQLRVGSIPKELEHNTPPGKSRARYCPYAVAAWFNSGRVMGMTS
jgi:hypothetical protein